jgi:hypothetical protein
MHWKGWMALLLAVAAIEAIAGFAMWRQGNMQFSSEMFLKKNTAKLNEAALGLFWKPVLNSPPPLLLCVGGSQPVAQQPVVESGNQNASLITYSSASAVANLSSLMGKAGMRFQLKTGDSIAFDDLRSRPAILIGGPDDSWILRATENRRFHFARSQSPASVWIEDSHNLQYKAWSLSAEQDTSEVQDYAIVGRFLDPGTNMHTVIAAGLGTYGTSIAGEFLTDPEYVTQLANLLPKDWPSKNIEVVIATRVIASQPGPLRVLAVEVW